MHCVGRFGERFDEMADALCIEAGKPIKDARGEVTRLIDTFRVAAEEAVRIYGEVMPLDISARAVGYSGQWKRVPIGPCSFISPFNFPLNLAAHKVAPALAVGCPFVLKPASLTPIGALIIGEVLAETDLPKGAFSILPCPARRCRSLHHRRPPQAAVVHGIPRRGLGPQGSRRQEEGGARARWQRRRCVVDEDADLDDAVDAHDRRRLLPERPELHRRAADPRHEAIYDEVRERLVRGDRGPRCRRPARTRTRSSGR